MDSCVLATALMLFTTFCICTCSVFTANVETYAFRSDILFEFKTQCTDFGTDFLLGISIALACLVGSWLSIFASLCDNGIFLLCDLCDGSSDGLDLYEPLSCSSCRVLVEILFLQDFPWSLSAFLLLLLLISCILASCFPTKRSTHRRCIVAARRVGNRRYGLNKCIARRWRLKTKRPSRVSRWLSFLHVFAQRSKPLTVVRPTSVGESACAGLTPRCRPCNAGDGP